MKRIAAIGAALITLFTVLGFLWNGYRLVVEIHGQYATKSELRGQYFQTRVDDLEIELQTLRDRRALYRTRLEIDGELTAADQWRLDQTIMSIQAKEPVLEEFKQSIRELASL